MTDRTLTEKMRRCISAIESNVGVKYTGTTFGDALKFIGEHKEKSLKSRYHRIALMCERENEDCGNLLDDTWYQVGRDDRW